MNDADEKLRQEVALFRYGLIADLLALRPGSRDIGAKLKQKAAKRYVIPGMKPANFDHGCSRAAWEAAKTEARQAIIAVGARQQVRYVVGIVRNARAVDAVRDAAHDR